MATKVSPFNKFGFLDVFADARIGRVFSEGYGFRGGAPEIGADSNTTMGEFSPGQLMYNGYDQKFMVRGMALQTVDQRSGGSTGIDWRTGLLVLTTSNVADPYPDGAIKEIYLPSPERFLGCTVRIINRMRRTWYDPITAPTGEVEEKPLFILRANGGMIVLRTNPQIDDNPPGIGNTLPVIYKAANMHLIGGCNYTFYCDGVDWWDVSETIAGNTTFSTGMNLSIQSIVPSAGGSVPAGTGITLDGKGKAKNFGGVQITTAQWTVTDVPHGGSSDYAIPIHLVASVAPGSKPWDFDAVADAPVVIPAGTYDAYLDINAEFGSSSATMTFTIT